MARTVEMRVVVQGRIECHGLSWKSDALLAWELKQRQLGNEPKVDVRIDELDLKVVYVDVPDRSVGPFKAISRQPQFTDGMSLFELNRLKKAVKDKALSERLGRLSDEDAMKLRVEFYAELGRGNDPVAMKRLSELQNQMVKLRLEQAVTPDATSVTLTKDPIFEKRTSTHSPDSESESLISNVSPIKPSSVQEKQSSEQAPHPPVVARIPPSRSQGDLPKTAITSIHIKRRRP